MSDGINGPLMTYNFGSNASYLVGWVENNGSHCTLNLEPFSHSHQPQRKVINSTKFQSYKTWLFFSDSMNFNACHSIWLNRTGKEQGTVNIFPLITNKVCLISVMLVPSEQMFTVHGILAQHDTHSWLWRACIYMILRYQQNNAEWYIFNLFNNVNHNNR